MEIRSEHIRVSIDRATHSRLKRAAAGHGKPVASLVREKILILIAEHEAEIALAPARREPWRRI